MKSACKKIIDEYEFTLNMFKVKNPPPPKGMQRNSDVMVAMTTENRKIRDKIIYKYREDISAFSREEMTDFSKNLVKVSIDFSKYYLN